MAEADELVLKLGNGTAEESDLHRFAQIVAESVKHPLGGELNGMVEWLRDQPLEGGDSVGSLAEQFDDWLDEQAKTEELIAEATAREAASDNDWYNEDFDPDEEDWGDDDDDSDDD